MDILETILSAKRQEVAAAQRQRRDPFVLPERPVYSMRHALAHSASGILAEFKRRSPSKGWIHAEAQVVQILPDYQQAGAAACSILTDQPFFGGQLQDLRQARELTTLPLLRKEFIVDEFQLYEAREAGADAVLLIAAALSVTECRALAACAHRLGLEVLLEIHQERELTYLNEHVDLLGVNNRNLGSFHTDVENSFRLAERLHREVAQTEAPLLISESGLSEPQTLLRLREVGFRGFLMGEAVMKSLNPGQALAQFIARLHTPEVSESHP